MIAFSIAVDPRGKGRPRATVRGKHATVYTDAATRKYEARIKAAAVKAVGDAEPLQGALQVGLRFRMAIPRSYPKKRRAAILAGTEAYLGAYDADNLAKAVLDACNGVAFADDKQVVRLIVLKTPAERPGVDIHIAPYIAGDPA